MDKVEYSMVKLQKIARPSSPEFSTFSYQEFMGDFVSLQNYCQGSITCPQPRIKEQ